MRFTVPNWINGWPEIALVVVLIVGWGGAIIHAIRLGRVAMTLILFLLLPGLWVLWSPLHGKVQGTCASATSR